MSTASTAGRTSLLVAHEPFLVALLVGVALRVVVMIAYRPALLFPDSFGYLRRAVDFNLVKLRPGGYPLFLKPITSLSDSLTVISSLQHLLGLALAVACYAFLLHRGVPHWAATLAALPVLLDPLQLVLEHYVLSDVLFEVLLSAACLSLLWRRRPGYLAVVVAGLLVGCSALVRGAGTFIVVVFVVALLCLRLPWRRIALFLLAVLVPVVPYAMAFHQKFGTYAVTDSGARFLYARLAPKVYCPGLELPSYERTLCPKQPIERRPDTNHFMWDRHRAAQWHLRGVPPGMTALQVVEDFDKRVLRAEPLTYSKAVLIDIAGGFAPTRTYEVPGYPASYWLFADHYWSMDQWVPDRSAYPVAALRNASADKSAASFLVGYRRWLWTPGPLMALLLLLAAGAVAGFGRSRRSGDRVAVGLLAGCCLITLATGAAVSGFSWRYQLPQLPMLSTAGVLAIAALARGRRPGTPLEEPRLRPLDRTAARVVAVAPPRSRAALHRATERGALQVALASAFGCALAVASASAVALSGWATLATAALAGACGGLAAIVIMVGSLRRAREEGVVAGAVDESEPHSPDAVLTGR